MQTDLSFLDDGKTWPPEDEVARIKGMSDNIDIFDGGRDSFLVMKNWMDKDTEAKPKKLHIKVPLPEKAVGVVLNGALPELNLSLASEESDKAFQDWLVKDRFFVTLEETGCDWCRCGVGVVKVSRSGERVKIRTVRPDCWIPVCYPDDDREFQYHILFKQWDEKDTRGNITKWLKVEIHSETAIEYRLYVIENGDKLTPKDLSEQADLFKGYDLDGDGRQETAGWCVFPVWNSRTSDKAYGVPDASFSPEALSIVEALEMALSQRRYNHNSHSKPVTVVDRQSVKRDPDTDRVEFDPEKPLLAQVDQGERMNAGNMVAFVAPPLDSSPHISQELTDLLISFVNVTELSAAMVSGIESANVASGRALMLELTPTMDHLRRFRTAFWDAIPSILESASLLSLGDVPKFTAADVTMYWELSLASDSTETAQRHEILVRSGIYSPQQCHREMGLSQEDSDKIMKELKANEPAVQPPGEEPLQIEIPGTEGEGEGVET